MSAKAAATTQASASTNTRPTLAQNGSADDGDDAIRTKILLVGTKWSGKTSIRRVLFENLNPKETFYIEPTSRMVKHKIDSFIPLEIWDCPGSTAVENLGVPLSMFASIIFVIDIQEYYTQPILRLLDFFIAAFQENPDVNLEVFVHKAEAMTEEYRMDSFRTVQTRIDEELQDLPPLSFSAPLSPTFPNQPSTSDNSYEASNLPIMYHLTSVYDHSLQEAFSRVFTRILASDTLPYVEELLNAFIASSSSSKAFLFDTQAKFFVATDSSPVDSVTFGLCCDYVHMLNQFQDLYKSAIESPTKKPRRTEIVVPVEHRNASPPPSSPNPSKAHAAQSPQSLSAAASRSPTPTHTGPLPSTSTNAGTAHYPSQTSPMGTPLLRSRSSTKGKAAAVLADLASPSSQSPTPPPPSSTPPYAHGEQMKRKKVFHPSSAVSLTPYTTLVYHAVTEGLALVALLPTSVWEGKRGLVEFNIVYFREGVQEIYDLEQETRRKVKKDNLNTPPQIKRTKSKSEGRS